jgi:hypothetical protein
VHEGQMQTYVMCRACLVLATWATWGKAPPERPTFQPYWGKPAVRLIGGTVETAGAAMLVGMLAGESPVRGTYPVAAVVISGDGAGDQSVESPEVKVLVGWGKPRSAPTGGQANRQVVANANLM